MIIQVSAISLHHVLSDRTAMNRTHLCRIIPILIWSLFEVTIVLSQVPQNQQLPDGKVCLFTCSEWIFEEKVAQFAPSANLLGPGQLSKHTIGLPCDHGSNSQTSPNNGLNYHNVWGAVYIIDQSECDAVIKQSQSEYEIPFISNEEVIVVKYGGMNCLAVDLGIQPGDHPPRQHPSHILPDTNQDEAYYNQLANLGVPHDYINGLQLASRKQYHHPIIPRDYHPARYDHQPNYAANNKLPNQVPGQTNDLSPSVVVALPHQQPTISNDSPDVNISEDQVQPNEISEGSPTQDLYPNQPFVEITPLELPEKENGPKEIQPSPSLESGNRYPNVSPQTMNLSPDQQTPITLQKPVQYRPTTVEDRPVPQSSNSIPITSTHRIPSQIIDQSPDKSAPIVSQTPILSTPSNAENGPEFTSGKPSSPVVEIPTQNIPLEVSHQPKSSTIDHIPVDENNYGPQDVNHQPYVVITPLKLPQSNDSTRPSVIPETYSEPQVSQKPFVQSTTPITPVSNIPNSSSPFVPSNTVSTPNAPTETAGKNVLLTGDIPDNTRPVVVITPLRNPGTVTTPTDVNQNQPSQVTHSKPQNKSPKSGVLGFPKPSDSRTLVNQEGPTPVVQGPITDTKTPTVLINPNHPVSGTEATQTPTVLPPNQEAPTVDLLDKRPVSTTPNEDVVTPDHLNDTLQPPNNQTPVVLISPNKPTAADQQVISPDKLHSKPLGNPNECSQSPEPSSEPSSLSPMQVTKLPPKSISSQGAVPGTIDANVTPPHLPSGFNTSDSLPVLPDKPMFIPNSNKNSAPPLPAGFNTGDIPPSLPDQHMFVPQDSNYSSHPLPDQFSTTDLPSALTDQPMFIPEKCNSPYPIPSHFATSEQPPVLPDVPMFTLDDNPTKQIPQQVYSSPPVTTSSQPHATGYIPRSVLDQNHQPHATGLLPKPTNEEILPTQSLQPTTPVELPEKTSTNITPTLTTNNQPQPHATGLLPKPIDEKSYPTKTLQPATPVQLPENDSTYITPTSTTTNQPHGTELLPKPTDEKILPTQSLQPTTPVELPEKTSTNTTPTLTTTNQPHATGLLPKSTHEVTHPVLPAAVQQIPDETLLVPPTQSYNTELPKSTDVKSSNPDSTVQSVTPVQPQQQYSQVPPASSSQVHATGLSPKLTNNNDQISHLTPHIQQVTPATQVSNTPSVSSQPKSTVDQNDLPTQSHTQIPSSIPHGTTQQDQNNAPSNYTPSTFMVPNYTPDTPILGYTFASNYPEYIQKYNPNYQPNNTPFIPGEFVPGFTFGSHCQLF